MPCKILVSGPPGDARGEQLDTVTFDFTDASTYDQAFRSVEKLFLVRPPALGFITFYRTLPLDGLRHVHPAQNQG